MMFLLKQALAHPAGQPLATEAPPAFWLGLATAEGGATFLPPTCGTVYGTLLNHVDALAALGEQVHAAPYKAPPQAPILYIKPRNTLVGHRVPVVVPADAAEVEIGATLGVVMGRTASHVSESVYRPSMRFKCRDGFCPVGPAIVARALVADPDALAIEVAIDGQTVQRSSTARRIRSVARLIADVTEFMSLFPGDVLMLGVAPGAPRARAGQTVTITIEGVGRLQNPLVAEAQP